MPPHSPTIGVFDSGFGGLTVLRALLPLIPGAHYVYLGDTARLPYGAKSQQTIARYALSSAAFLLEQGIEMLVVACNTASALALDELTAALPIPVIGVIAPGTAAAAALQSREEGHPERSAQRAVEGPRESQTHPSPSKFLSSKPLPSSPPATILVLATAATVQSAAYSKSCAAIGLQAYEKACPLLVPLVEEGWIDHPVTAQVARIYLTEALAAAPNVTTLLLGCTHYPLLKPLLERTLIDLNHPLHIVDSAAATAQAAATLIPAPAASTSATTTFYATDSIEKFRHLGTRFLGHPVPHVTLIDLGG